MTEARRILVVAILAGAPLASADAQRVSHLTGALTAAAPANDPVRPELLWPRQSPGEVETPPWWAPAASAIVPGAGQVVLGQDRALAYFAVEGYAWLRYAADAREARRQRRAYRALAMQVARSLFPGPKPNGDFEYYERMEAYLESGAFDTDPTAEGIQPDPDTTSYNGALWLKARRLFWEHPDAVPDTSSTAFRAAQDFYLARAVRPEYEWSWRDARLEHDLFRRTIARSNEAFRRSIADLGVILANHVLSTVDTYVSVRLRREQHMDTSSYEVRASVPWPPLGRP